MIKPKCLHWIPALYCLSQFLIGLCLFHFQTIIGAVLLQGIELAQRLMADTLCSLGLYKSDLLPPRSRNRWVGIRLPAWSTTVQESDSGVVVCCLTCRLQDQSRVPFVKGRQSIAWRMWREATNRNKRIKMKDIQHIFKNHSWLLTFGFICGSLTLRMWLLAVTAVRGELRRCRRNSHLSIS